MTLRLGILVSGLMTAMLSLALLYASANFLLKSDLSYLGFLTGSALMVLAAGTLLNIKIARRILSIFYFLLSLVGAFLIFRLPPEGLLIFLPSVAVGTYLWRYSESERAPFIEGSSQGADSSHTPSEGAEEGFPSQ